MDSLASPLGSDSTLQTRMVAHVTPLLAALFYIRKMQGGVFIMTSPANNSSAGLPPAFTAALDQVANEQASVLPALTQNRITPGSALPQPILNLQNSTTQLTNILQSLPNSQLQEAFSQVQQKLSDVAPSIVTSVILSKSAAEQSQALSAAQQALSSTNYSQVNQAYQLGSSQWNSFSQAAQAAINTAQTAANATTAAANATIAAGNASAAALNAQVNAIMQNQPTLQSAMTQINALKQQFQAEIAQIDSETKTNS